jgi:chemotaxis protein MotD
VTRVASETVNYSGRTPQFQRNQSASQASDNDTPFALMLEASAPPADPAPRQAEPVRTAEKTTAAPAASKKSATTATPEKKAAGTSDPADGKVAPDEPDEEGTKEAATEEETPVIAEGLPEIPQSDETSEDGSETADVETVVVQVQTDAVQPQQATAPDTAITAPAVVTAPETVVPAQADGDTDPELFAAPAAARAPAAKPADLPADAPAADAPELPLTADVKGSQAVPDIKGKIEGKPAEQPAVTPEPAADTEIQLDAPQQAKTEQAHLRVQPEETKQQPTEAKPNAEAQQQQPEPTQPKPAVPHVTALDSDATNTPLPPTHQQPATDVAALTANNPRAATLIAQNPVPVSGIAVEITAQAKAGNNRFEIRLDPPELGRIDVRLDVDQDGNVKSRLVIDRADTYDLLRKDASTLERALQQAGLKTSDSGLEFTLRDQGAAQRDARDQNQRNTERGIIPDAEILPAEAASGYGRVLGLGSGVDIRI